MINDVQTSHRIIEDALVALKKQNEKMYIKLQQKIKKEVTYTPHSYAVITGLVDKRHYDNNVGDKVFYPMLKEDLQIKPYDLTQLLNDIKDKKPHLLCKAFVMCDYLKIKKLLNSNRVFKGIIATDEGDYKVNIKVELSKQHMEEISSLYKSFIHNQIPWKTVNTTYISKMIEIYVVNTEDLYKDCEIKSITIDFEEFNEFINYNLIPVWNVTYIELMTKGFPTPCEDYINYQHHIPLTAYDTNNSFLIQSPINDIEYINHYQDEITIINGLQDAIRWHTCLIKQPEETVGIHSKYPFFSNYAQSFFIQKYQHPSIRVRTKAELIQYIKSCGLEEYISFKDLSISTDGEDSNIETYNMNPFIIDEIRQESSTKKLVLLFQAHNKGLFFIRDLLSYIISEIQYIYPEYDCVGRVI